MKPETEATLAAKVEEAGQAADQALDDYKFTPSDRPTIKAGRYQIYQAKVRAWDAAKAALARHREGKP